MIGDVLLQGCHGRCQGLMIPTAVRWGAARNSVCLNLHLGLSPTSFLLLSHTSRTYLSCRDRDLKDLPSFIPYDPVRV